jgi:hypothetical protein
MSDRHAAGGDDHRMLDLRFGRQLLLSERLIERRRNSSGWILQLKRDQFESGLPPTIVTTMPAKKIHEDRSDDGEPLPTEGRMHTRRHDWALSDSVDGASRIATK